MSITILVGGQFGSEGKGKTAAYLASEFQMSIRTGGPNAGHTIWYNGDEYKLRSVPCAFVNKNCVLGIGAGAVIDAQVLLDEIQECEIEPGRLFIDPHVGVIEARHKKMETELKQRLGSTGEGVGAAIADKVLRTSNFRLARNVPELQRHIGNVARIANDVVDKGAKVFLEGTQGFGLSLHHGSYPFVTGRDTTAGTLLGEAGLSPTLVDEIIMVIRTYPIRVGGPSGPMGEEITWDDVTKEANSPHKLEELTTVTRRVRRVARFDKELVKQAVKVNRPTQIAVNFVDYIDFSDHGKQSFQELTKKSKMSIRQIEQETNVPVTLIGTGPKNEDTIDLRGISMRKEVLVQASE